MTIAKRPLNASVIYFFMGGLAVVLMVSGFFVFYETYTDTRAIRSEAYFSDRFYLAKKYLAEEELWLESSSRLTNLEAELKIETVIFLNSPINALSARRFEALEQFVNDGGHLIYAPYLRRDAIEPGSDKLLKMLGTRIKWESVNTISLDSLPETMTNRFTGQKNNVELVVESQRGFGFVTGSGHIQALATQQYGRGIITLVNDSRWWLNKNLVDSDHALLLKILLGERNRISAFWSPYRPSLWDDIWKHFRDSLLLFLLMIGLWMHAKSIRRVRISKRLRKGRRSLGEHIMAVGWLHWRYKNRQTLLRHLIDDIEYSMMKQNAHFRTQPDNIKMQLIALNSNFSHEEIERLWTPCEPRSLDFVVRARRLKRLRTLL